MNSATLEGKQVLIHTTSCGTLAKSFVKYYKLGNEDGTMATGIESENVCCHLLDRYSLKIPSHDMHGRSRKY